MDELIHSLRTLALNLERDQDTILVLNKESFDITEYIQKCTTDEDIINLAKMILDGHIPYCGPSDDNYLKTNRDDFVEDNAGEYWKTNRMRLKEPKELIKLYHDPESDSENEDGEEDEESLSLDLTDREQYYGELRCRFDTYFSDEDMSYKSFGELFEAIGYEQVPQILHEITFCLDDLFTIITDYLIEDGDNIYVKLGCELDEEKYYVGESDFTNSDLEFAEIDYIERFYECKLNNIQLIDLVNAIIQFYDDNKDFESEDYDSELEAEELLSNYYEMLEDQIYMLDGCAHYHEEILQLETELQEAEGNWEEMETVSKKIEEYWEEYEDKIFDSDEDVVLDTHSDLRKRKRIEYDMMESPLEEIRFEQQQTDLLLDQSVMKRFMKEIAQDVALDLHFEEEAFEAIQTAAEDFIIKRFEQTNKNAIHGLRTHINPSDMFLDFEREY